MTGYQPGDEYEHNHNEDIPNMVKIRCWIIKSTDKAYGISAVPHTRYTETSLIWIPKSQLEHVSKDERDEHGWIPCEMKMPEWLAEKHNL